MIKKFVYILLGISFSLLNANSETPEKKIGNFANDRTPATYFGFGQYIEDKGTLGSYLYMNQEKGKKQNSIELCPLIAYSPTDSISIYGSLPLIVSDYDDGTKSRGIGDLITQFEYAFWDSSHEYRDSYATIVANMSLPTASTVTFVTTTTDEKCICEKESLGYGVPTFFLGTTISTLSVKWYAYADLGATIVSSSFQGIKVGNELLYAGGFGYNLAYWKNTIITMLFDINGIYTQKDKEKGIPDNNTGGHIIYVGPTLFFSHKSWVLTGGIQGPALQHLNGNQRKKQFRVLLSLSVQFDTQ